MDGYAGFAEYVAGHRAGLSRAAYLLTGDVHAAEDIVQDALVTAASRWRRIREGGDPDPYVRRILYTRHIDRWRRLRRTPGIPVGDLPEIERAGDHADDAARRLTLRIALMRLTPKQRAVLVLRYFEDLTEVETADILDCSVGTVKSQTRHALERLRVLAPDILTTFSPSGDEVPR